MKSRFLFTELIDMEELRAMLHRLYEARSISVAVLSPEGSVIAEYDKNRGVSKRNYNRFSCLKASLQAVTTHDRCVKANCSHKHANLICPIVLEDETLAYLVLYHWPAPSPNSFQDPVDKELSLLETLLGELAALLSGMALNRRQCLESRRALEEKSYLFQIITENIVDTVWLMDLDFRVTFASSSVMAKRGYTLEELRGMTLEKHLTPDSYRKACELMVESLQSAERESQVFKIDMEYCRKDGSTFWNETHLRFIRNLKGEISAILGVGRDITERLAAEQQISRLNRQLAALGSVEATGDRPAEARVDGRSMVAYPGGAAFSPGGAAYSPGGAAATGAAAVTGAAAKPGTVPASQRIASEPEPRGGPGLKTFSPPGPPTR